METIFKDNCKKTIAKRNGDLVADKFFENFDKETRICGLTNGRFSLISLIHSVLKKIGKADVLISTWSAGVYDATVINNLKNSGLITDFKIILDRSFVTRQKKYGVIITDLFENKNIRTTDTHAKFVLISNNDYKICIRSSMNLNENKRCENFDLDNNEQIFNLFNDFAKELFQKQESGLIESRKIIDPVFNSLFNTNQNTSNETVDYWGNIMNNLKIK